MLTTTTSTSSTEYGKANVLRYAWYRVLVLTPDIYEVLVRRPPYGEIHHLESRT